MEEHKVDLLMRRKFTAWNQYNNFCLHQPGRMLVLWNPKTVVVSCLVIDPQIIHMEVSCKITATRFLLSLIYGFHTITTRRPLWDMMERLGVTQNQPWMILSDFNSVLFDGERQNGAEITPYEIRDCGNCIRSLGFMDTPSFGTHLTRTNGVVWSKLDRVMINSYWMNLDGNVSAQFLPLGFLSDHCAWIATIVMPNERKRRSFKFFDMWMEHETFPGIVQQHWNAHYVGTLQYILCKKLKSLKAPLRILNRQHYMHISNRADSARAELEEVLHCLHNDPTNEYLKENMKVLKRKAWRLGEAERRFLYQKAKCKYFINANRNTKLFHAVIKKNAKMNFIAVVVRDDGSVTASMDEVVNEFLSYYHNLVGTPSELGTIDPDILSFGPTIFEEDSVALMGPISDDEIKEAIFGIGNDKSLGPNGFTSGFFKGSWNLIGREVCDAIKEFFSNGKLLKGYNWKRSSPRCFYQS